MNIGRVFVNSVDLELKAAEACVEETYSRRSVSVGISVKQFTATCMQLECNMNALSCSLSLCLFSGFYPFHGRCWRRRLRIRERKGRGVWERNDGKELWRKERNSDWVVRKCAAAAFILLSFRCRCIHVECCQFHSHPAFLMLPAAAAGLSASSGKRRRRRMKESQ